MRHVLPADLDAMEELLAELRLIPGIREKSRGVFYLRSTPFLHFHSDPAGRFADLRMVPGPRGPWTRLPVTERTEQAACLQAARKAALQAKATQ